MPIPLRSDFDASQLHELARKTKDGPQARRLLALAAIYEGASRTEATRIGGGYISLKFNTGLPAMSYYDAFNADLKYAELSSKGKWVAQTVASKNSQRLTSPADLPSTVISIDEAASSAATARRSSVSRIDSRTASTSRAAVGSQRLRPPARTSCSISSL